MKVQFRPGIISIWGRHYASQSGILDDRDLHPIPLAGSTHSPFSPKWSEFLSLSHFVSLTFLLKTKNNNLGSLSFADSVPISPGWRKQCQTIYLCWTLRVWLCNLTSLSVILFQEAVKQRQWKGCWIIEQYTKSSFSVSLSRCWITALTLYLMKSWTMFSFACL